MCIGNTSESFTELKNDSVYPYVYREHLDNRINDLSDGGLSLCV